MEAIDPRWRTSSFSGNGGNCVEVGGWRRSSFSGNGGGTCVEVSGALRGVLVRDTKDRAGPVLGFTAEAWRRFADRVKRSP